MKTSGGNNQSAAFNLIELLVVVVLIAMIAALLLPAVSKAKEQSAAAGCLNNQKQLAAAMHMYAIDNDEAVVPMADYVTGADVYPAGGFWGGPVPGPERWNNRESAMAAVQEGLTSSNALYPYCESVAAYHCPGDPRQGASPQPGTPNGWGYDSYSKTQNVGGEPADDYWGAGATYTKMTAIPAPGLTFTMMESADWRGYNVGTWVVQWSQQRFTWVDPPSFWHLQVSSTGFADGHADLHKWADPAIIADGETAAGGRDASRWRGPSDGPDYYYIYNHYLFPGHL